MTQALFFDIFFEKTGTLMPLRTRLSKYFTQYPDLNNETMCIAKQFIL